MIICDNIYSRVPTWRLISLTEQLETAIQNNDIAATQSVKDQMSELIENWTIIPRQYKVKPSASTMITNKTPGGIILDDQGYDLKCAAHKPVSQAIKDGVCACLDTCKQYHNCHPERKVIRLETGSIFQLDSIMGYNALKSIETAEAAAKPPNYFQQSYKTLPLSTKVKRFLAAKQTKIRDRAKDPEYRLTIDELNTMSLTGAVNSGELSDSDLREINIALHKN